MEIFVIFAYNTPLLFIADF